MTEEEINFLRVMLPEKPDEEFRRRARQYADGELGDEYLIFTGERVKMEPSMEEIMITNSMKTRTVWAARCSCTACGEEFLTRKVPGLDAIEMYYGDDGCMYTMDPDGCLDNYEVDPAGLGSIQMANGDRCYCPICCCEVMVISTKKLKGGRTKGIQMAQLLNLNGYAVILYWLVNRTIDEDGLDLMDAEPRDAFVLADKGRILHFSHGRTSFYGNYTNDGHWRKVQSTKDTWDKLYHDWGSINNKKRGTILYPKLPSLVGTTGEKTGLYEYWRQRGILPVEYLKAWKKWPCLENLVNDGLGQLISELVKKAWNYRHEEYFAFTSALDLTKRKPHEILQFTKEEYRRCRKDEISIACLRAIWTFRNDGFQGDADHIMAIYGIDEGNTLAKLMDAMKETGDVAMDRYLKYMDKQECTIDEIQTLLDARDFARRINGSQDLSQEELWPRRLRSVHDRLAEIITARENREKAEQYQRGFDRVLEQCQKMEWTDGELCIRLPRCNEELVQEGKILHHCVGGYGERHSQGKDLIFFVRRYRRPERSYYTLNISMGLEPKEIQLHGYGNERHGDKKQYRHKIPKKVREFCNRWEREVLAPYCQEHYKETKKEKSA